MSRLKEEISISKIWNNETEQDWEKALSKYYNFIDKNHVEIEKEMETLDFKVVKNMTDKEFYEFLYNKYFYWKYTEKRRYVTTTNNLKKYIEENNLRELDKIKKDIFLLDFSNIKECLLVVKQINGLGVAGASGLLSVLYPKYFGTVDKFAVLALKRIKNLGESKYIKNINENNIKVFEASILVDIYRRKAKELNERFNTDKWTPRMIDKILWVSRK